MEQLIRHQVHRLPTEDKTNVLVNTYINPDKHNQSPVLDVESMLKVEKESNNTKSIIESRGFKYQHLHFITEERPKEGEWYLDAHRIPKNSLSQGLDGLIQYKIIASTDPKLTDMVDVFGTGNTYIFSVANIPKDFIKAYCEQGGIDEVDVECETLGMRHGNFHINIPPNDIEIPNTAKDNTYTILKLNPDNTVITHLIEEKMYSERDVIDLITKHTDWVDDHIDHDGIMNACCPISSAEWDDEKFIKKYIK